MKTVVPHTHRQSRSWARKNASVLGCPAVVVLIMASVCGVAACDDTMGDPQTGPIAIVDNTRWVPAALDADPFPDHRDSAAGGCDAGVALEGDVLEVDTGKCHYLNVRQALQTDLMAGRSLRLTLFHAALVPLGGASGGGGHEGHAALSIDGDVVWERRFEIPHEATPYTDDIVIDRSFAAGDEVVFHLHNHGANTWKLLSIQALPSPLQ